MDPEAASEVFTAWAGQQPPIVCGLIFTRRVAMTLDISPGWRPSAARLR